MSTGNNNEDTAFDTRHLDKRLMGNVVRLPIEVGAAKGSSLFTTEGKIVQDFWGDEGVCSLGYNTKEWRSAVSDFLDMDQPHQLPDVYPNQLRWDAAEKICSSAGMDRIFFTNSGAESNETAIKLARKYSWDQEGRPMERENRSACAQRHNILTVAGNFHGRTAFAMAACDYRVSPYHRFGYEPLPEGFGVLDPDQDWRLVVADGDDVPEPIPPNWSMVSAVTLAPILGNNVVKTYSKEFWEQLGALRAKFGFIIIHDDVQAGSGRCGHYATYQAVAEAHGLPIEVVKPDILCLGKGMAMGFPMSAVLASEEVAKAFTPGVHFNTFAGSPFICHMALRYFGWLEQNLPAVRNMGDFIRNSFRELDWVKDVDGMGMMNAFTPDYEKVGYSGFALCHAARNFGLSIVTHREFGPIRFTPPMNVTMEAVDQAFEALESAHNSLSK